MNKTQRNHKFGAKKITLNGHEFPSQLEAAVYQVLQLRERAGEICNIQRQTSVRLKEKCPECGEGPVVYKVDFSATHQQTHETIYIEAKGVKTSSYLRRERLWRKKGPGVLEVWGGSWKYPKLIETIIPKEWMNE